MTSKTKINSDLIIRAAVRIVDEEGTEALTLATLAQRLDIRPPSLYNHIAGLPELRKLLAFHGLEELRSELLHAAVGRAGEDAIRAMAYAYLNFARSHPGLYELSLLSSKQEDEEWAKVANGVAELVIRALESYRLDPAASVHAARALRSLLHGFASLERHGGFGLPFDRNESFAEMVGLFLAGLQARPTGTESGRNSD